MATFKRFEDIEAWKAGRLLYREILVITSVSPFKSDFGLKDQIKRASGSIMDNIAEGFGRGGNKEFIQFLSVARGSATETQSQLYRALDSQHIGEDVFQKLYNDVDQIIGKIINLMKYLSSSPDRGRKYDNR